MSEQDQIDQIENYLHDRLTPDARKTFEVRIENDAELRNEVELYRKIFSGIQKGSRKLLKDELIEIENGLKRKEQNAIADNKIRFITPWTLGIAASLLAIMVALFFVLSGNENKYEQLYRAYYQPYPNVVASIERGESVTSEEKEAFEAYEKGDYKKALSLFEKQSVEKPQDVALKFYSAISLMEQHEFSSAADMLDPIAMGETDFSTQAKWYSALCLIRLNKKNEAQQRLHELSQQESAYQKRASDLLNALDNNN